MKRDNKYKDYVEVFLGPNFVSPEQRCPKGEVPSYHESGSINDISKVNVKVHSHFLTVGYRLYCTNINSPRSIHCILKFYDDTKVLRSKLQIFHNSIVPQFPEET